MIITFQKTYRYSPDGLALATYYPGDTIDVDPEGSQSEMVKSVLENEIAIEVKPELVPETKTDTTQEDAKPVEKPGRKSRGA